jgi:heavy metal efflux system protein
MLEEALKEGINSMIRPVVATALMVGISILAAISISIKSETPKPSGIAITGGLIYPIVFNTSHLSNCF